MSPRLSIVSPSITPFANLASSLLVAFGSNSLAVDDSTIIGASAIKIVMGLTTSGSSGS